VIVGPEGTATKIEQLIGRTHRTGQSAERIHVDMIISCVEHERALDQLRDGSQAIADLTGSSQKALTADWRPSRRPENLADRWSFKT
jgi:hypothetical protein